MTDSEFVSRPRYPYQIAYYLGIDKRTLYSRLSVRGYRLRDDGTRLLLPYEVRRIIDILRLDSD